MIKELVCDVLILAFIGLLSAGAKHLHDGNCSESDHGRPAQTASVQKK